MPAIIRKYQSDQVERAVNPVGVRASQTSLGQLGQGISDVGEMFDNWQDEIDTADAKAADSAYSDLIRQELYADQTGFMYSQGGDAVNRRGSVAKRLEDEQQRILDDLSPSARNYATSAMEARYQRALQTVDQYTAGERRNYLNTASEARLVSAVQDAIFNPDQVAQSIATADQELADLAAREGWPPEVLALNRQKARTEIHSGIIGRLEAADPIRALEYLRSNRSQMTGSEVSRLEGILVPRVREHRGRQAGQLAAMSGVSETYLASIRSAESGGNDAAENPNSTATGRYQFIASTWAGLMERYPDLGLTVDGRFDADQQERAIRAFTKENAETLQRNGIAPTNGNLYAAHFLGAGGAVRVLGGNDGALVSSIVSQDVISANSFLEGMTVADFRAWSHRKGGGDDIGYSAQAGGIESLLEIADPDERAAAMHEYKLRTSAARAQAEAQRQAAEDAAFKFIINGGNIDKLPLKHRQSIGLEGMKSLRNYSERIAAGPPIVTDNATYVQLSEMMALDPDAFMASDPITWYDKLDEGDRKYFIKQRSDMLAGRRNVGSDAPSVSTLRTAAKNALSAAGLSDNEQVKVEFESNLLRWSSTFTTSEGRAPLPVEINDRITQMLVPIVIDPIGFGNKQDGRLFQMDYDGSALDPNDDLTPEMLRDGSLWINGVQVSNEMINDRAGSATTVQELVEAIIATGLY